MYIRNFTVLFLLCLVALPATASAQISMTYLGLEAIEFDDDFARRFNASFRRQAGEVAAWSMREGEPGTASTEAAFECSLTTSECRRIVLAHFGTGSLIYGQMMRTMSSDGNDFDYLVRLFRYDALEARLIAADQVSIPRYASVEELDAIVARLIRLFSSGDAVPSVAAVESDPRSAPVESSDFPELVQPASAPSAGLDLEYIGWPLVALAAVTFGSGLATTLALDGLNNDPGYMAYQYTVPPDRGDVCTNAANNMIFEPVTLESQVRLEQARNACSNGAALEIAQIVLYVVSGLSAVAGGILIGYDLSLQPSVGTDHAYLGATLAF